MFPKLSLLSYFPRNGLPLSFLGVQWPMPNPVLHLLGLCQSWVKWNNYSLCHLLHCWLFSLWSPTLFSAYTVISCSILNFLRSLDFSFQSVTWFVFCLVDFRLLLEFLRPVFSAISILRSTLPLSPTWCHCGTVAEHPCAIAQAVNGSRE